MARFISAMTALLALTSTAYGAALTKVNSFGANPTGAEMYIYVPDKLATNPAVLVAIHWCTGTAQAIYDGTQFKTYADQYGFIVIYPDAPDSGGCWDVHSPQTLQHDAGGDSLAIASMVRYTLSTYKADAQRVYGMGVSSGAMMSNVLAGAYPDLFAGFSAFAGVPFGCYAGSNMWNTECATGRLTKSAAQWGDLVRAAYPGYTGRRPKMQIWHGTEDEILDYNNFDEAVKQWTNVFGVSTTPTATQTNSPLTGWTRRSYGPNFQAISAQGVSHDIRVQEADVMAWFGLNTGGGTTATTTASPTTTSNPGTGTVAKWGQCGGLGYSGPTTCVSGSTCVYVNDWYSQCR